ncbi:hypothetical protein CBM2587_B80177 [Cupriavidus taiwanensis]|uniref:Uncharacterized protein n=1 Tax=Cupriavidus taiwanensis TaxID=164546 RepID=A0A375CAY6_9BURK|nr:hypothetical protein CBM2587_B80177 [Cupriavidus taiwanensis]
MQVNLPAVTQNWLSNSLHTRVNIRRIILF